MNSMLLRTMAVPRNASLQAFSEYRELEAQNTRHAVTNDGALLEYETLELRVHPPNVIIDNEMYEDRTVITVDSANRPGTLVEVVQCLTEMGLNVRKARISSDGGWFVDEFHVTESANKKVTCDGKLKVIKKMLSVEYESEHEADNTDQFDEAKQNSTVFELAGQDRAGLLSDVIQLLTHNGCDVRSAAVWTYNQRVAFVVSVLEKGGPIRDGMKLGRLKQLLAQMMDGAGKGIVAVQAVKGQIHYERRLHQLMLREEEKAWEELREAQKLTYYCSSSYGPSSGGSGAPSAAVSSSGAAGQAPGAAGLPAGALPAPALAPPACGLVPPALCCVCWPGHPAALQPPAGRPHCTRPGRNQPACSPAPGAAAGPALRRRRDPPPPCPAGPATPAPMSPASSLERELGSKLYMSPKYSKPEVGAAARALRRTPGPPLLRQACCDGPAWRPAASLLAAGSILHSMAAGQPSQPPRCLWWPGLAWPCLAPPQPALHCCRCLHLAGCRAAAGARALSRVLPCWPGCRCPSSTTATSTTGW
jgi:glycine cleavage system regulatory protein